MTLRPWQALLDRSSVERAWKVIDHIATALRAPPDPYDGQIHDDLLRAGLFAREAGFAVFYDYLARAKGDDRALREVASDYLACAVDRVEAIATERPQFSYGFSGTAWAVQHLRLEEDDDDDSLVSIDDALAGVIELKGADAPFMLNNGFVGYGVYALERMPRPSARRCLEAVCRKLLAAAEVDEEGARWRARGQWLVGASGSATDQHHTGIRSGAAGPLAVLGAAARWGVVPELAPETVARGIAWVSSRSEASAVEARAGYAGGRAAMAAALLVACRDEHAFRRVVRLARTAAHDGPCDDVSLETGVAGDAQAFARLYHATGHSEFRAAARSRLEQLLDTYDATIELGGYRFLVPDWERVYDPAIPTGYRQLPGISLGVAGVALALLAAVTPIEPAWDRMFLLSARDPGTP